MVLNVLVAGIAGLVAARDLTAAGHDVVVIIGASELNHKLSNAYNAWRDEGHIITTSRRGLEAVADALTTHAASGQIGGRVLFWHTGGTPGFFAN